MNIISFVAIFLLPSVEDDTELIEKMNNLIWELIFSFKDEKLSPESTYSALKSVSIENGLPLKSNVKGPPRCLYLSIVHGWYMLKCKSTANNASENNFPYHVPANLYGQYLTIDVFADHLRSRMIRNL